jgi:hypothetical protein
MIRLQGGVSPKMCIQCVYKIYKQVQYFNLWNFFVCARKDVQQGEK